MKHRRPPQRHRARYWVTYPEHTDAVGVTVVHRQTTKPRPRGLILLSWHPAWGDRWRTLGRFRVTSFFFRS